MLRVVVLVTLLAAGCSDEVAVTTAPTTIAVAEGRWTPVPTSPLSPRWGASAVWSGEEVVLWGGYASEYDALVDGARYDPAAETWTPIPSAPVPHRGHQEAVWAGGRLLVWVDAMIKGLVAGAEYSPADGTWKRLPPPPDEIRGSEGVAATDDLVYVLGVTYDDSPGHRATPLVATYDPAARRWAVLPALPAPSEPVFLGVVEDRAYVFGCAGAYGVAYDDGRGAWEEVAPPPTSAAGTCISSPPLFPSAFPVDNRVAVWHLRDARDRGPAPGAVFDAAIGTWRPAAPHPMDDLSGRAAAGDGRVMLWGGGTYFDPPCDEIYETEEVTDAGFVYSLADDRWTSMGDGPLAPRNAHSIVWQPG